MKLFSRLLALLLCLCLLSGCVREQEPETDPVDPDSVRRATKLTALVTQGELPEISYGVSLFDSYGLPISEAQITLSIAGEEMGSAVTDEEGVALFSPAVEPGVHSGVFSYAGSTYYQPCTLETELVADGRINRSGVYVRAAAMDKVDFEELEQNGAGNLYLHQEVLSQKSKVGIEEFIAEAAEHEIQVHLWLICLWDQGNFVVPINTENGDYLQEYFSTEAEKVREAAALSGLGGLHFDYIRFEGENPRADKFRAKVGGGGEHAVTEFVRQMTAAASAVNPDLVYSGAVMAQYADLIPKYGQDIAALSAYLDYFVPMLYAGNYGEDTAWIEECMRMLRQNFAEVDFRPALLSYQSDQNTSPKTEAALSEEIAAVYRAGAQGVTLFYYQNGLTTLCDLEPEGE